LKPDDKRQHLIRLTSTGQTLQIKVENALSDLMKTANKGLSINDRSYFERIMQQIITHLEHDQTELVMILCDVIEEDTVPPHPFPHPLFSFMVLTNP